MVYLESKNTKLKTKNRIENHGIKEEKTETDTET